MLPCALSLRWLVVQSALWFAEAGALCDTQWCTDAERDCNAGSVTQPCSCEKGTAHVLEVRSHYYLQRLYSKYSYTCCMEPASHNAGLPGTAPSPLARFTFDRDGCGSYDSAIMKMSCMSAVLAFVVGVLLVAGGRRHLSAGDTPIESRAEDVNFENSIAVVDGRQLHCSVPPQKWCVTRQDLQQFRRLVRRAVVDGRIQPTELDQFDPIENTVGPSVHSVNQQYIIPVTSRAGKPSWALMLHPEGLECDMFITHAWQEGIYEFVDKVLHSWPAGKKHAYVCFLSNPQNLDIAGIIADPRDSPFAHALRSATDIMVVPNRKVSIYSRIWCTYEAYLGYTLDKRIFCASMPVHDLRPRLVSQLGVCIVGVGIGATIWLLAVFLGFDNFANELENLLNIVCVVLLFACAVLRKTPTSMICRRACAMGAHVTCVTAGLSLQKDITSPLKLVISIAAVTFGLCLEADRLWAVKAGREKANLCSGYTGHVREARCFVASDGEKIHREIQEQERAVDHCVEVLIRTGLSTSHLRSAAERAGRLGNVSNWYTASVVMYGGMWILFPALCDFDNRAGVAGYACTFENGATAYLCILQGMVWFILFFFVVGSDCKAFAAKSLQAILIIFPLHVFNVCVFLLALALIIGPFVLTLTLAGPANIARIPLVGPSIVCFLIGDWDFRDYCTCRSKRSSIRMGRSFSLQLQHGLGAADVYGSKGDTESAVSL